jgi:hypothetical protein
MPISESTPNPSPTPRPRRARPSTRPHDEGTWNGLSDVVRAGRSLPRKVKREMALRPEVLLATVGGASFLAGAVLGSRLGRALLAAAIPIGLERLISSEIAPKLVKYAKEMLGKEEAERREQLS